MAEEQQQQQHRHRRRQPRHVRQSQRRTAATDPLRPPSRRTPYGIFLGVTLALGIALRGQGNTNSLLARKAELNLKGRPEPPPSQKPQTSTPGGEEPNIRELLLGRLTSQQRKNYDAVYPVPKGDKLLSLYPEGVKPGQRGHIRDWLWKMVPRSKLLSIIKDYKYQNTYLPHGIGAKVDNKQGRRRKGRNHQLKNPLRGEAFRRSNMMMMMDLFKDDEAIGPKSGKIHGCVTRIVDGVPKLVPRKNLAAFRYYNLLKDRAKRDHLENVAFKKGLSIPQTTDEQPINKTTCKQFNYNRKRLRRMVYAYNAYQKHRADPKGQYTDKDYDHAGQNKILGYVQRNLQGMMDDLMGDIAKNRGSWMAEKLRAINNSEHKKGTQPLRVSLHADGMGNDGIAKGLREFTEDPLGHDPVFDADFKIKSPFKVGPKYFVYKNRTLINPSRRKLNLKKRKNGTYVTAANEDAGTTSMEEESSSSKRKVGGKNADKRNKKQRTSDDEYSSDENGRVQGGGGGHKWSPVEYRRMDRIKKARYFRSLRPQKREKCPDKRKMFGSRVGSKRGLKFAKSGREDSMLSSQKMAIEGETKKKSGRKNEKKGKASSS